MNLQLTKFYDGKRILVTGGASFIGSHLVEFLLKQSAKLKVIDDLSSGKESNLDNVKNNIEFFQFDLRNKENLSDIFNDVEIVFHLAAIHGGRGFIENYQIEMLDNFSIDTNVFSAARLSGVKNIVHASSACAYPINLQNNADNRNLLSENQANFDEIGKAFPDGVYGWTKLIGEYQLKTFSDKNTKGRSARIFTAYGERENLSHAAIALIAKSDLKLDPFPVWGDGNQTRNFTHVSDTVKGLSLLGADERDLEFDVFNIGTSTHIKVIDFISEIHSQLNWKPKDWNFELDKPTGVSSRASDNSKILNTFGWEPNISIKEGIEKTIDWYLNSNERPKNIEQLNSKLLAR
jgi:UDP-glucose 4-epimerase